MRRCDPVVSKKVSAMHARLRQLLQQAAAVVVSARRWIVWSLPVIWLVTGVILHFSRTWLCVVTMGTSMVTLFLVWRILNTRNRHARALSLKLDHLERAIQQGEKQLKHAMKKMHRGQHNGETE
jgi:low affinity Fe/Cu permease